MNLIGWISLNHTLILLAVSGKGWYELGLELEIKSADLEEIRRDSTVTDKLSRVYQMWLSKKTKAATRRQLIEALKTDHVGQISVAINYEQELNKMVSCV